MVGGFGVNPMQYRGSTPILTYLQIRPPIGLRLSCKRRLAGENDIFGNVQ